MDSQFSQRVKDILTYSKEEAIRLGNSYISPEHLFLGILRDGEGVAIDILLNSGVDLLMIKGAIEKSIRAENPVPVTDNAVIPLLKSTERILKLVHLEARSLKSDTIESEHLLLAILKDDNALVTRFLKELDVDYQTVRRYVESEGPSARADFPREDDDETFSYGPSGRGSAGSSSKPSSETPVLDNFGIDLTKAAEEGRLDPIVGRDREIERLAQILSRRKKNNPVLIGEPGVGKSAIAEGLALRIVKKNVSRVLFNKRVVALDLASIVAGTKYRGQFEERMKAILNELSRNNNIILFIDEIHTIVGAGGATGSLDAANMLKPALARGEIQCIGATTLDEYREHIEKDGALERRFQKVLVEPTTIEETINILHNIKERYEEHHNVIYTDAAIEACVKLTNRYITDRHLPDKAIDALDEAGSRVHISNIVVPERILALEKQLEETKKEKMAAVKNQNFEKAASFRDKEKELLDLIEQEKKKWEKELAQNREIVDADKVAEVVAMMTGIPVQRIAQTEGTRLLKMADELKASIVGQDEAIEKVVKAIQRNRAGLKDPNKPIGSFIFLGPTGVGKTQLAKVLAKFLFDSTDNLIRIDMSEYMEKFSVSRLVGAPPGYVGYEEGGQLTEKVRRKPYSVVLLDEIEKAHPDVFNILLQVLDEGQLTDSLGRRVDFRNTIVILTSNIGSRQLAEFGRGIGFETAARKATRDEQTKSILQKALQKTFAPEFLNRIDDVIIFNPLEKEDIEKIIDIELKGLYERIKALGYELRISKAAKDFIAEKGFDPNFGARPLKRAIQKYLEDPMAEVMIKSVLEEGDYVSVGYNKAKDEIRIKIKKRKKTPGSRKTTDSVVKP
ncbi:MAG TPA: ATP-dependent Clp protease ATP-binding subunit [Bacteroidales bacterium]|nr:ATP-dependent Clp protease ATP-binding subunit [Bacteroidales bacterium]HOK74682.1 ATP-dependent Clp protease ATP-binding subunit [Bacteroidales bacterium]HOM39647.1 ATP-dependent Clp protease ATP-binding subunit [Bacteroidales bacterium]HPP91605.1 ATP-dependent Clp protease ATP-binding subunit [Bacteroidales bacterium]HRR15103.1 ATP-dependent Clp protease ATP-binding subunit [Bacteroidales bacterium]